MLLQLSPLRRFLFLWENADQNQLEEERVYLSFQVLRKTGQELKVGTAEAGTEAGAKRGVPLTGLLPRLTVHRPNHEGTANRQLDPPTSVSN